MDLPLHYFDLFNFSDNPYSFVRLPFLDLVLLYSARRIVPITPAETALLIAATIPCVNTRFTGSA